MKEVAAFGDRLAPDTINRLERAAQHRYESANVLFGEAHRLSALYLYGYTAEICLATAYFRSAGFTPNAEIDRDIRNRRMAQARLLEMRNGEKMMSHEAHPIVGWARFLEYQRGLGGGLTANDRQRLREAINKATFVYRYWRPELRYKVVDVGDAPVRQVQKATKWLLDNQTQLYRRIPMPVIKGTAKATFFKAEDRAAMIDQLTRELGGEVTAEGPVVFEISLHGTGKIDVLVVWEKWKAKDVAPQTRSEMILAAYGDKQDTIAQPLGVTYEEAMEQHLLPYAVVPLTRKGDAPLDQLKAAMKKRGGFVLDDGKVDLRFPTMEMTRQAHEDLLEEVPKGYWSIVQYVGPMS